ncbi:hypothetical protein KQI52_03765 [bacterium]|nr:hypothetical protein [bacterium]
MNRNWGRWTIVTLTAVALLAVAGTATADDFRLKGSIGGSAYGYQDPDNQHHVWMVQQTSASLYKTGSPWSLHFSGGWTGDNVYKEGVEDDVLRFTRGYLRYGDLGSPVRAKLGRFFLVRGPAIGVLDGIDVNYRFKHGVNVALFGGLWGPITREFEFEDPDESMAFGGEVGWVGRNVLWARQTHIALSYANIQRDKEELRNRVGLQTTHRFTNSITWYNLFRFRTEGTPLRRFISRLRMNGEICSRMLEVSAISAEAPDESYFADFDETTFFRVRAAADRWLVKDMWGLGFDVAALMTDEPGYRIGPYAKFPFGRIGYRFYAGDQPTANGFWAQANYMMLDQLEVYGYGSFASYEWEAFDNTNDDASEILSLYGGVNYYPAFLHGVSMKLEYQHFQTPQYDQDRRAMIGLRWGFDTAEVTR